MSPNISITNIVMSFNLSFSKLGISEFFSPLPLNFFLCLMLSFCNIFHYISLMVLMKTDFTIMMPDWHTLRAQILSIRIAWITAKILLSSDRWSERHWNSISVFLRKKIYSWHLDLWNCVHGRVKLLFKLWVGNKCGMATISCCYISPKVFREIICRQDTWTNVTVNIWD